MKRHGGLDPEVVPHDIESPKDYGLNPAVGQALAFKPPNIQPYQGYDGDKKGSKGRGSPLSKEMLKKAAAVAGVVWLGGWFLGYGFLWPLYPLIIVLQNLFLIPPFSWLSWIFSWIWAPFSWLFGASQRGAPLVAKYGALQELRLPADQVSTFVDKYVQEYGDGALIFAAHDGYPQLAASLLTNKDLGYRDLVDATDDNGNTALIYAASKGYLATATMLLRSGADVDVANTAQGSGGRTAMMEAAGAGHKDICAAIRLSNATIDLQDDYGNTALIYAAYHGHLPIVIDLVKGGAKIDVTNQYGHTAASYAETNKQKGVVDYLNRAAKQPKGKNLPDKAEEDFDKEDFMKKFQDLVKQREALAKEHPEHAKGEAGVHVKGGAEDLHQGDNFAPKLDPTEKSISDSEMNSLEGQVARLKREHNEAELRTQRSIVQLLEEGSKKQQQVDDAERRVREARLNHTELSMKVEELTSKQRSQELDRRELLDKHNAFQEEVTKHKLEAERLRSRSEATERERDQQASLSRRYEEDMRKRQEDINDHLARQERMLGEAARLRDDIRKADEERRRHQDRAEELEKKHRAASAEVKENVGAGKAAAAEGVKVEVKEDVGTEKGAAAESAKATAAEGAQASP